MKNILLGLFLVEIIYSAIGQSTIKDLLKDGYEAVFDYKNEYNLNVGKLNQMKYEGNVHVQKGKKPLQFVLQLKNVNFTGKKATHEKINAESSNHSLNLSDYASITTVNPPNELPTEDDIETLSLPFLVQVDKQFVSMYLRAFKNDTVFSLGEKHQISNAIFHKDLSSTLTLISSVYDSIPGIKIGFGLKANPTPFGDINANISTSKTEEFLTVAISSKRSECGDDINMRYILSKLNSKDIDSSSNFKFVITYNSSTLMYHGFDVNVMIKSKDNLENFYEQKLDIKFKEHKPIEGQIDNSSMKKAFHIDQLTREKLYLRPEKKKPGDFVFPVGVGR